MSRNRKKLFETARKKLDASRCHTKIITPILIWSHMLALENMIVRFAPASAALFCRQSSTAEASTCPFQTRKEFVPFIPITGSTKWALDGRCRNYKLTNSAEAKKKSLGLFASLSFYFHLLKSQSSALRSGKRRWSVPSLRLHYTDLNFQFAVGSTAHSHSPVGGLACHSSQTEWLGGWSEWETEVRKA